jgi:hypothetical protein
MDKGRIRAFGIRLGVVSLGAAFSFFALASICLPLAYGQQTAPTAAPGSASRRIGAIKAIAGTTITLTPDSGPDNTVTVQPETRIVRIAPGEKDLKNAKPIQLQDLQVGDRILVAGKGSEDNQSLVASSIVAMTHSDLAAQHQKDLQDWQKRGTDGVATTVDATGGTVTISVSGKNVVLHTSKTTVIRRYAPDSVKFDDAKPSTIAEIHAGDQVRARGERSADGGELAADEIVSGSFRNIAGTVNSIDASSSTVTVHDLLSKKNVTVKITADSQLRQLPAEMAQRMAARLKRTAGGATGATATGATAAGAAPGSDSAANGQNGHQAGGSGATAGGGNGGARRSGGAPDLQQMLGRLPAVALTDLHKGDAVVVLSTEGSAGVGTIITLLTGVEPILQAAPNASGASILSPWSLGMPSGDSGGP